MTKITWKPGTMLSPLPPALITSGTMQKKNVMTAAWTGIICSDPVITYVSIRPSRYSHELISKHKEFVINIPTSSIASAVDTVGVKSGRELDKFALTGLTAVKSSKVSAPQISQCPISMECKVLEVRSFGTHDMFLAEVVAVNVDDQYLDSTGALDLKKANLLAYAHGFYYALGQKIGKFGFSVEKKKTKTQIKKTILKADEKFGLNKKNKNTTFLENGVEVVIAKPHFKKTNQINSDKQKKVLKKSPLKTPTDKFRKKNNKKMSMEPYSFKKKSDGSFKKKSA